MESNDPASICHNQSTFLESDNEQFYASVEAYLRKQIGEKASTAVIEAAQQFSLCDGDLHYISEGCRQGRRVVRSELERQRVLQQYHVTRSGVHRTSEATATVIKRRLYWKHIQRDALNFVLRCQQCSEKSCKARNNAKGCKDRKALKEVEVSVVCHPESDSRVGIVFEPKSGVCQASPLSTQSLASFVFSVLCQLGLPSHIRVLECSNSSWPPSFQDELKAKVSRLISQETSVVVIDEVCQLHQTLRHRLLPLLPLKDESELDVALFQWRQTHHNFFNAGLQQQRTPKRGLKRERIVVSESSCSSSSSEDDPNPLCENDDDDISEDDSDKSQTALATASSLESGLLASATSWSRRRGRYGRYSVAKRESIASYASQHGIAATCRRFEGLTKSTVRNFVRQTRLFPLELRRQVARMALETSVDACLELFRSSRPEVPLTQRRVRSFVAELTKEKQSYETQNKGVDNTALPLIKTNEPDNIAATTALTTSAPNTVTNNCSATNGGPKKAAASSSRGQYQRYDSRTRLLIGRYALSHGTHGAVTHFRRTRNLHLPESTVRTLKSKVSQLRSPKTTRELQAKRRGRPVLLGQYEPLVRSVVKRLLQQKKGTEGLARSFVVIAAAKQVLMDKDPSLLKENGGHVDLNQTWADSFVRRLNL